MLGLTPPAKLLPSRSICVCVCGNSTMSKHLFKCLKRGEGRGHVLTCMMYVMRSIRKGKYTYYFTSRVVDVLE